MLRSILTIFTRENPASDGFQSPHEPGSLRHSIDWIRGQLSEIEKLTSILFVLLSSTIVVYSLGLFLRKYELHPAVMALAMSGLVAVFGTVTGGALGFLFGIPRLPRRLEMQQANKVADTSATTPSPHILSNSNLEEISDWLTKIIVGLGLIHLSNIPTFIGNYRSWLVNSIGASGAPPEFAWFLLIVTLTSGFTGFLFFYIQTRTRMAVLFQATEAVNRPSEAQARTLWWQVDQFAIPDDALRARDIKRVKPVAADATVAGAMPSAADSADQWAAWAASQARGGRFEDAAFGWRTAIERDAGKDARLREKYAEVLQALNKDAEALRYYEQARQLGGDEYKIRRRELLVALYVPPPTGFEEALDAAEALAKFPQYQQDVWVKVWHLSALGQKHAWLLANRDLQGAAALVPAARKLAIDLVDLVTDAKHPVREFLRQLIDPKVFEGDPQENDLESFKAVPEVYDVIARDAPKP